MASVPYEDRFLWLRCVGRRPDLGGTAKSVAIELVDHLNSENNEAWPSIDRLADTLGVNEKTVRTAVAALDALGFLVITPGCGRGQSSRYRLTIPDAAEDVIITLSERQQRREKAGVHVQKGGCPRPEKVGVHARGTSLENLPRTSSARATGNDLGERPWEASIDGEMQRQRDLPDAISQVAGMKGLLRKASGAAALEPASYAARHADDGLMQLQLADRLGPGGWEILGALPPCELDRLTNAMRHGRVDKAMIENVKLMARAHTVQSPPARQTSSPPRGGGWSETLGLAKGPARVSFLDSQA